MRSLRRRTESLYAGTTSKAMVVLGAHERRISAPARALGPRLRSIPTANPQAVGHRWRIWWPLFVAALVLLMFEVAVRKVALPESWRLRWQGLRDRPRQTTEDEPEYEELRAAIAKVREQHLEALRGRIHYRPDDPGVRARLYLASFKRSAR